MNSKLKLNTLLFVFIIPFISYSQFKKSGIVINENKEPLSGVTIKEKGTNHFAISDQHGTFKITIKSDTSTLMFFYIGYDSISLKANKIMQEVVLSQKSDSISDVIVIGYGTTNKRDLTGSIAKAPIEDMKKAPVGSYAEALEGRVAGVTVTSADGQPGAAPDITIRGSNSISQDNSPLFVIDGFPIENPDPGMLDPNNIESMEILKDASATAVYGARGSNGVIIITTKIGKIGPPRISFNSYVGYQKIIKKMGVLSPYEFVKLMIERDSLNNNFVSDPNDDSKQYYKASYLYLSDSVSLDDYKNVKGTDFQDLLFRPSLFNNYDLSISGGDQKTKYMFSGNYFNQNGIIINSGYQRIQGRINIDQTINPHLKWGLRTNYSSEVSQGQSTNYGSSSEPSTLALFSSVWAARPVSALNSNLQQTEDLADEDFDPLFSVSGTSDYRMNPVTNQENTYNKSFTKNLNLNAYLEWKIINHLLLRVNGGLMNRTGKTEVFYNSKTIRGNTLYNYGSSGPNGSILNSYNNNYSNENILNYNNTFASKHNLDITGVLSIQQNKTFTDGESAIQVPNESLGISGLDEGTPQSITSTSSNWMLLSYTGRINYNYNRKYYFTASWRADGSSKFSTSNKWGYFPSAAVKWSIINEEFMKTLKKTINDLSIRATYGKTGNNRVPDFSYLSAITVGTSSAYVFNGSLVNGVTLSGISNPKLKWETTSQWDIGLDLTAVKERIVLNIDYYKKKTTNLLLNANLPGSTGYQTGYKNIGSMQNSGLEITLNSVNISEGKFSWTSNFNISFPANKVLALSEGVESLTNSVPFDANFSSLPMYISKIGSPVGLMYGLIWDGLYQYNDFNNTPGINTTAANAGLGSHWYLKPNQPTNGAATQRGTIQPGDIKYKDLNNDGIITTDDYTVIGRVLPKHFGGLGNTINYDNWSLNIFFQWSYGNNILNANRLLFEGNPNNYNYYNQFETVKNRWTPENQNATIPRTYGSGPNAISTRVVEDGSYLRLKTINLSYSLPKKLIGKIKINEIRIYVSAQNVLTFTKYSGPDPEVSIAKSSILTQEFDYSPYPRARTIVGGININF